jgi:hypothetical protein
MLGYAHNGPLAKMQQNSASINGSTSANKATMQCCTLLVIKAAAGSI